MRRKVGKSKWGVLLTIAHEPQLATPTHHPRVGAKLKGAERDETHGVGRAGAR